MARLLVEIEEELKRELKARLARNGETLKTWLTRAARAYVGETRREPPREAPRPRVEATSLAVESPRQSPAPQAPAPRPPTAPPSPAAAPEPAAPSRPPRRNDDYLD